MNVSAKTAMTRKAPSVPLQIAHRRYLLPSYGPVLDFGCGKGADVAWMNENGYNAFGYDPNFTPDVSLDILRDTVRPLMVLNSYVLNVIEDIDERNKVVSDIYNTLAGSRALFTARSWKDVTASADKGRWGTVGDGYRTNSGSFQRGFTENDLQGIVLLNAKWTDVTIINSEPPMVLATKGY